MTSLRVKCLIQSLIGLLLALPSSPVLADPNQIKLNSCVVVFIDEVAVPAELPGVLKQLQLQEGMSVVEGETIALIDDRLALLDKQLVDFERKLAAERAENMVQIEAAGAQAKVADAEYLEAIDVNNEVRDAIPRMQVRRLDLSREQAKLQVEVAEHERRINLLALQLKAAELARADYIIGSHRILSPVAGVVNKRFHAQGEWVDEGTPVVSVIRMDRLRAEAFLNVSQFAPQELIGAKATISVWLTREVREEVEGTISVVSPTVQTTGDYRAWCDFKNPQRDGQWVIRPGMNASMTITIAPARRLESPK